MKKQFMKYLNDYENLEPSINIVPDSDFDYQLLDGNITFSQYKEEEISEVVEIIFSIFNSYEAEEFWDMADSISGDFEFVASTYNDYCTDITENGSIAIIDNFIFHSPIEELGEKLHLISVCLKALNNIFRILGIDRIVFMTKSIIMDLKIQDRRSLVNEVLKMGYIPIYQDKNDVVVAKNLNYL